jgi:DNA-binding MarR family transcriptional regulator
MTPPALFATCPYRTRIAGTQRPENAGILRTKNCVVFRAAKARGSIADLTPAHDAVLALLDWLPEDTEADAELIAELLGVPETEAATLLDELEAAGYLVSATGPVQ